MAIASNILNEVIQKLQNHGESLRIKKMIFYLSKNYWENEPKILNSVSWEDLITEILQSISNLADLKSSLYKLVKSLNRPQAYGVVAQVIFEEFTKLYEVAEAEGDTGPLPTNFQNVSQPENILDSVVSQLENHPEKSRIKKIIYAASKKQWAIHNSLDHYDLKELLLELIQNYPNKADLKIVFQQIVSSLNKPDIYRSIANLILEALAPLYDRQIREEQKINHEPDEESSETTKIIYFEQLPIYQNPRISEKETSIIAFQETLESEIITGINLDKQEFDLFEIRLEIMQFTNILRTKILLYSILFHSWDKSGKDWLSLRSYSLGDLLEQLIKTGAPMSEIETKIHGATQYHTDVDSYQQTASQLVEILKRFL